MAGETRKHKRNVWRIRSATCWFGLALAFSSSIHAQVPGLGQTEIKVSGTFSDDSEIEGIGTAFSFRQWKLSTPFFYKKGDSMLLAGTFVYTLTDLDFNAPMAGQDNDTLHEFKTSLLAMLEITEKWRGLIMVAPSHASDLEDFDRDGMSWFALLAALYEVNPRLGFVFGVFQSTGYDENRVLPAVGLRWTPSERFEFLIAGPQVSLRYKPTENTTYSVFTHIRGTRWNTVSGNVETDLRLRGFSAGLGLDRRIAGNVHFNLDAGLQFLREMEVRDAYGGLLLQADVMTEPFVRTGLSYRF